MAVLIDMLKSLFFQGNWNLCNMQGTGFAWLARARIRRERLVLTDEDKQSLNGYFNTTPAFVNLIVSIFIKESSKGRAKMAKNTYAPAMAALGASFFWHALRPFLFLVTLLLCFEWSYAAIALYPIVYSALHLFFLVSGGFVGSVMGMNAITFFDRIRFKWWADILDNMSTVLLGAVFVQLVKYPESEPALYTLCGLIAFALGYGIYRAMPRITVIRGMAIATSLFTLIAGGLAIWKAL